MSSTTGHQVHSTVALQLDNVTRRFGGYIAIEGINLAAQAGAFVSVVGPSGCGKSTLLNLAAGLIQPSEGCVSVFGDPLSGINRKASYMFQHDALLPWKTAIGNIELGLRFRGVDAREATERSREWVTRVGLDGFAESYPAQLSGGMRKRVAMAQSWIVDPDILLMDEPFSALDVHTRLRMEDELLTLWASSSQKARKTILFVTHDLEEAIALADEVLVLSAGPASRVVNRYPVELSRPRDLIDIRTDARFHELYGRIWSELREEVLASYARAT